jgi:hypothetical protein
VDQSLRPMLQKLAFALVATLAAGFLVTTLITDRKNDLVFGILAALIVGGFSLAFALRRRRLTYVGEEGVVIYSTWGNRAAAKPEVLLFANAAAIRTHQVRQYYNGVYTGTSFDYKFSDPAGKRIFRINGTYRDKKGRPKANSLFNVALASEASWNAHYHKRMVQEFESTGGVTFDVDGRNFVRVLPGALELNFKGQTTRVTPDDIKGIGLSNGHFSIHTKEARWFSGKGKFSFEYGRMANAQVFLFAVEKLVGYQFGGSKQAESAA